VEIEVVEWEKSEGVEGWHMSEAVEESVAFGREEENLVGPREEAALATKGAKGRVRVSEIFE
jgi:hypothetical protein